MNTRIRYSKPNDGVLTSRRNFTISTGQEVKVELDLNSKTYRVLDAVTGAEVATGGNTVNVSVLKIQSKRALSELGAVFDGETRVREVDSGPQVSI